MTSKRQGIRPLSRRRQRWHPLPHLSRHARDQGRVLHPRHLARPLRALYRRRCRLTSTTCSGCCASSKRPRRSCREPRCGQRAAEPTKFGVIYFGSTAPAMDEAIGIARKAATMQSTRCACARFRSIEEVADFIADHDSGVRRRAEPRRAIAHADGQRMRHRSGAAHADPAL